MTGFNLGFILALTLAAAPLTLAHEQLYSPCSLNTSNFVAADEVTGLGLAPTSLEECDNLCVSDSSCTYFTWSPVAAMCKHYSGDFAAAPGNAEVFTVSGIAGCSTYMMPEDKVPCETPVSTPTFGSCEPSSLATGCHMSMSSVRLNTGCTFCGEAIAQEFCPLAAPYTLCDDATYDVDYRSYSLLEVHCYPSVCQDVQVILTMVQGNNEEFRVFDDGASSDAYCGSTACTFNDRYLDTGEVVDETFSFDDDLFYVNIYEFNNARYKIALGSGNGYAITCNTAPNSRKRSLDKKRPESRRSQKQKLQSDSKSP